MDASSLQSASNDIIDQIINRFLGWLWWLRLGCRRLLQAIPQFQTQHQ